MTVNEGRLRPEAWSIEQCFFLITIFGRFTSWTAPENALLKGLAFRQSSHPCYLYYMISDINDPIITPDDLYVGSILLKRKFGDSALCNQIEFFSPSQSSNELCRRVGFRRSHIIGEKTSDSCISASFSALSSQLIKTSTALSKSAPWEVESPIFYGALTCLWRCAWLETWVLAIPSIGVCSKPVSRQTRSP